MCLFVCIFQSCSISCSPQNSLSTYSQWNIYKPSRMILFVLCRFRLNINRCGVSRHKTETQLERNSNRTAHKNTNRLLAEIDIKSRKSKHKWNFSALLPSIYPDNEKSYLILYGISYISEIEISCFFLTFHLILIFCNALDEFEQHKKKMDKKIMVFVCIQNDEKKDANYKKKCKQNKQYTRQKRKKTLSSIWLLVLVMCLCENLLLQRKQLQSAQYTH